MTRGGEPVPDDVAGRGLLGGGREERSERRGEFFGLLQPMGKIAVFVFVNEHVQLVCGMG